MIAMKTKYTALVIVTMALVGLSACSDDVAQMPEAAPGVAVQTQAARYVSMPQDYRYAGTVQGTSRAKLSARMMGRIEYQPFEEGDAVRKGQTLARLRSADVAARQEQVLGNLREAEAARDNAAENDRRMAALFAAGSATKKERDDAATQRTMAESRVDALQGSLDAVNEQLAEATVKAPFSGVVVRKWAQVGDMASPGLPILTIEDTKRLEVVARIPEGDIARFAVGDTVGVEGTDASRTATGVVSGINPAGQTAARQYDVRVRIASATGLPLKSGMYARVVLRKGQRTAIAVPEAALVRRGQLTGLFVVDDQARAFLRWVQTGSTFDGWTEILAGLSEGETLVVSHEARLTDGDRVQSSN